MNLKENRKNTLEYLKEFNKSIPKKKSLLTRNSNVDNSKLNAVRDKISLFYERAILISPMSIDKDSIDVYMADINLVKQFTSELKPEKLMESKILKQTQDAKSTRRILLPSVIQNNSQIMEDYNKMVAYYLLMEEDKPIERFSVVEMSMKQYGVKPDIRYSYYEIWRRNNKQTRRNCYIKSKISKRMGIFQKASIT